MGNPAITSPSPRKPPGNPATTSPSPKEPPVRAAPALFSPYPGKRRTELFYLLYTPVWTLALAAVILTGTYRTLGDPGYLAMGTAFAVPLFVVPLFWPAEEARTAQRANAFLFALSYFGNYAMSPYFFELLGMRYRWPNKWNWDAYLIGAERGRVPFWLTPLTAAYFATYHGIASVARRWIVSRFRLGKWGDAAVVCGLAYALAFAETYVMASPIIDDVFEYSDRDRMLKYGSICYGIVFLLSFPAFSALDEDEAARARPLWDLLALSMGCCFAAMMAMDTWANLFGKIIV
ncbi:hypothetical protein DFJ74DRAFT_679703 [Hyaloraphidium curvatum]|nr:hypothetical protein DFJ74DRAFT_679703 [Hyaloraphidium curvatum]